MMSRVSKGVFDILDDWMKYANYQLERRADIYFARYLPEIMKLEYIGEMNIDDTHIIPEFPIIVPGKNTDSKKIDYAVFGEKGLYFIELKTTMDYILKIETEWLNHQYEKNLKNSLKIFLS